MIRQISKFSLTNMLFRAFLYLFFALAFSVVLISLAFAGTKQLQNVIVTDPLSGYAIGGYDPVSYFTNSEPVQGLPEYEYIWFGVPWIFSNEANRDIFALSPEIYSPIFGGHGSMGLARGYLSDGNPNVYEVLAGRLFLFYSISNRDAFMLAQRSSYIKAQRNWEFFTANASNPPK